MNGLLVDEIRIIPGVNTKLYKALDGIVGVDNGIWVDVRGYRLKTLQVTGITVASVEIAEFTSDKANKPVPTNLGDRIGNLITADGSTIWNSSSTWVRIGVTAYTSGTITAFLNVDRGGE